MRGPSELVQRSSPSLSGGRAASHGYRRPWWYRGAHLQTLWGPLLRWSSAPPLRRERVETPDGDFLDLDWLADVGAENAAPEHPPRATRGSSPLVLILHGLEGSSRSHYALGLLRETAALGLDGVGGQLPLVQRGAEPRRAPVPLRGDVGSGLGDRDGSSRARPRRRLGLVGVSLGRQRGAQVARRARRSGAVAGGGSGGHLDAVRSGRVRGRARPRAAADRSTRPRSSAP